MNKETLVLDLEQALAELPMFDAHTHLIGGRLGARGLHDILLYHMVVSDLYAAGCPSGARLTQYPGWADDREAHARIEEALPFLPHIRNTSCSWMLRTTPCSKPSRCLFATAIRSCMSTNRAAFASRIRASASNAPIRSFSCR